MTCTFLGALLLVLPALPASGGRCSERHDENRAGTLAPAPAASGLDPLLRLRELPLPRGCYSVRRTFDSRSPPPQALQASREYVLGVLEQALICDGAEVQAEFHRRQVKEKLAQPALLSALAHAEQPLTGRSFRDGTLCVDWPSFSWQSEEGRKEGAALPPELTVANSRGVWLPRDGTWASEQWDLARLVDESSVRIDARLLDVLRVALVATLVVEIAELGPEQRAVPAGSVQIEFRRQALLARLPWRLQALPPGWEELAGDLRLRWITTASSITYGLDWIPLGQDAPYCVWRAVWNRETACLIDYAREQFLPGTLELTSTLAWRAELSSVPLHELASFVPPLGAIVYDRRWSPRATRLIVSADGLPREAELQARAAAELPSMDLGESPDPQDSPPHARASATNDPTHWSRGRLQRDLGEHDVGTWLFTTISVLNDEDRPLRLIGLESDCYLASPDLVGTLLGSGEEITLPLRFRLPAAGAGSSFVVLRATSSDRDEKVLPSEFRAQLSWHGRPAWLASTRDLGRARSGDPIAAQVVLVHAGTGGPAPEPPDVLSIDGELRGDLHRTSALGRSDRVVYSGSLVSLPDTFGVLDGTVRWTEGSERRSREATVTSTIDLPSGIQAAEPAWILTTPAELARGAGVTLAGDEPWSFLRLEGQRPGVRVECRPAIGNRFLLSIQGGSPSGERFRALFRSALGTVAVPIHAVGAPEASVRAAVR